jgi:hypothetical protein
MKPPNCNLENVRLWPKAAVGLLDCREAAFDPKRTFVLDPVTAAGFTLLITRSTLDT